MNEKELTPEDRKKIADVAEAMNQSLSQNGIPMNIAACAAILLAAEYAAISNEKVKDLVELYRRNLVHARKRIREAQN